MLAAGTAEQLDSDDDAIEEECYEDRPLQVELSSSDNEERGLGSGVPALHQKQGHQHQYLFK